MGLEKGEEREKRRGDECVFGGQERQKIGEDDRVGLCTWTKD